MKGRSRSRMLLTVGVSLVLLLFSGVLVGGRIRDEIQELEKREEELTAEYDRRKKIEDARQDYREQTERFDASYEELTARYPAQISQNGQILYLKELEDTFGLRITAANYSSPEALYRFQYVSPGNQEGYELIRSTVQFPVSMSYDQWKRFLAHIAQARGREVIEAVSAVYNESTTMVDVNITLSQFAIRGSDRTEPEQTTEVETGSGSIFSGAGITLGGTQQRKGEPASPQEESGPQDPESEATEAGDAPAPSAEGGR